MAFRQWWEYARTEYLDLGEDRLPQIVTMYYDPLVDVHHRVPISPMVGKVTYLLPIVPEDARRLFDGAIAAMGGLENEIPDDVLANPRNAGALLHAAKEWGLDDLATHLQEGCNVALEPTWDHNRGEFTWGCGLDEEHPRGQYNALLALAEAVGKGAWTRFATRLLPIDEPLVTGVDFPTVALSEARWEDGELRLRVHPLNETVKGKQTSFRVVGLDDPTAWTVSGTGSSEVVGSDLVVTSRVDGRELTVRRKL